MKKVLKKFNRTLSIMLAAAMVLTMVPQTAMPVLAAEPQIEETVDVTPADEATDVEEAIAEPAESEEEESKEGVEEDSSEAEDSSEDEETPVMDSDSEDEPEAEEQPAEEVAVPDEDDSEEPEDGQTTISSEINAALISNEATVEVVHKNKDDADKSTDNAEIFYVGGCVSGGKVVENRDLVFRVVPKDGRVLDSVSYKIGDVETVTDKTTDAKNGSVTISKTDIFEIKDGETTGKPITITVVTRPVIYTVKLDTSTDTENGSNYRLYAVTGEGEGKLAADAYSTAVKVEYGKSLRFALVAETGNDVKPASIKLSEKDITFEKKQLEQEEAEAAPETKAAEKKTAYVFTVDPSKAEYNLAKNEDAEAKVDVVARELYKLTVTMPTTGENIPFTLAASDTNKTDSFISYNSGFTAVVEESDNLAKSLAFKVSPTDGNVITDVTASIMVGGKKESVTVAKTGDKDKECTIALSQLSQDLAEENLTLTVEVETELDEEATGVTKITFTGDLDHAEYKAAGATTDLASAESGKNKILVKEATDNKYYIQITPNGGYALTKGTENDKDADGEALTGKQIVTIKETRKIDGETASVPETYAAEAYDPNASDNKAKAITLNLAGKTGTGDNEKNYTVTAVEVTIGAAVIESDDERKVTFSGDLLDSVTIKNDKGVVRIDEDDTSKTYAIAEGTGLFQFDVAAENEPEVKLNTNELEGTAAEGIYSYSIPAVTLLTTGNTITVNKAETAIGKVTVKVDTDNLSEYRFVIDEKKASLVPVDDEDAENEYTLSADGVNDPAVGSKVSMTLVAKTGVVFGDVTYTVKGGEAQTATVSEDKKTATAEFTVTDDVEINVETEAEYRVELSGDGVIPVEDKENAYKANYDVKNIKAVLIEGVSTETDIYDVVVLDDTTTAATTAKIETGNKAATIEKIEEDEYGKTLTIRVYKNSKVSAEATLAVSGVSTGVTVKMDGKAVEEVTMPSDSQAVLEVSAEGTEANTSDLKAAIVLEKKDDAAAVAGKVEDFFNTTGAVEINNDGKITIDAKPAKDAPQDNVFLVISSKTLKEKDADGKDTTADKEFVKIPLNLTGPLVKSDEIKTVKATAAASSNRAVRLNLDLEFANAKKMPKAPLAGDLYYKVEFTKVEGDDAIKKAETDGTLELKKIADLTRYEKIAKSNGSYSKADLAKFAEFDLVASFKTNGVEDTTGDLPGIITAEAKVTLVQSLSATPLTSASVADDYVANDDKAQTVTEGFATREPIYETKLSVKLVNGAAVFTGQTNVKVATPTFSKGTTCDDITVQFVNSKTGTIWGGSTIGNRGSAAEITNFAAGVNEDNSVWVSCTNIRADAKNYKDLGVKVTAHAQDDEYKASAVVKLKVQQGIYSIETDESKAALPETLLSDSRGVVKSVKITTILNDKNTKPAKSNLTWEITGANGRSIDDPENNIPDNIKKALTNTDKGKLKPTITVKNGTVVVTKDYVYDTKDPAQNTFYVIARAADFADNTTTINNGRPICFTISKDPQVIDKLAVVNGSNKSIGEVSSDKNGAVVTLKAEEVYEGSLRVVALQKDAKLSSDGYYDPSDYLPATISISGKLVTLDKESNASQPILVFSKPGDKITVTAKVVDGSKAKDVKMTLNVKPFEKLGLKLSATDGAEYAPDRTEAITYSGSSNEKYSLSLQYYSEYYKRWQDLNSYKSVKVQVGNGKFVADKNWAKNLYSSSVGSAVVVAAGKDTATITLRDAGAKNVVKNIYTINAAVNTGKMKAPNIKMTSPKKLTAKYDEGITWKVSDQDKTTKMYLYAGQYVKLAPDYTVVRIKDTKYNDWRDGNARDAYDMLEADGEYFRIDENGEFVTELTSYSYYLAPGSYKMVATIGTIADGKFTPTTKDKKLSFTVPKDKAKKTSLNVTGSYKLDVKSAAETQIIVKSDYGYTVSDAKNVIKKDQELNDHSNNFTKYFEVKRYRWDEDELVSVGENVKVAYATIGLKSDLTVEDINKIVDKKLGKDDCTGYITVDNGFFRKDIKITISFNELKKYTAKADPIFENSAKLAVNVEIYNGKTPVSVRYAAIDTGEKAKNDITPADFEVSTDNGRILLERNKGFEAGKYTISLKVVPWSVATIYADDQAQSPLDEAKMLESYAIPAELKLEVKELAKADKTLKTNLTVKLASYEYSENKNSGYERGDSGKYGAYRADVPYTLTANNITVKEVKVALDNNEIGTEKIKLVEAANGTAKVWNNDSQSYDSIPAINLKVNKEALEKAVDAKEKPLYYGKNLTVPVEITYENTAKATATETVKYKITIPKKPADTFDEAAVKSKLGNLYVNIDSVDPANTINLLTGKVYEAVASLVPADTDYMITDLVAAKETTEKPEESDENKTNDVGDGTGDTENDGDEGDGGDGDGGDEGEEPVVPTPDPTGTVKLEIVKTGKAVISFNIKNNVKTTEAAKPFSFTYDLGIKPNIVDDDIVTLASLRTEVTNAGITYAADKTAEAVMADLQKGALVKKVLDDAKAGRKNYSIKATVKHIPATKIDKAKMDVTVEIRNLTKSERIDGVWKRVVTVTKTVKNDSGAVLNTFDMAYNAVSEKFAVTSNTNTTITGIVDDCSGEADDIWLAIEEKAKALVNNPEIKVTVENKNYNKPSKETDDEGNEKTNDGSIQFTIKLEENGRVRNFKVAKVTIPYAKLVQYASITTVETEIIETIITAKDGAKNGKLKEIANSSGNAINEDKALKAAIETELQKLVSAKSAEEDLSVADAATPKYPGYIYEIKDWAFTAATKRDDATLKFDLVITSKGNSSRTQKINVNCTDLITQAPKYQTLKELAGELATVTEVEVDVAPTKDNWESKLVTALGEWDETSERTITVDEVEAEDGTKSKGTFTGAVEEGDGVSAAPAKVEGVKVTVKEGTVENEKSEKVTLKTITFKVKETSGE